ncbi:hypothetical protein FQR65_LT16414 [Abscondita terminalis]|nr:hypothetical protein FQR65_LT16414 [Abscondita terminalis]
MRERILFTGFFFSFSSLVPVPTHYLLLGISSPGALASRYTPRVIGGYPNAVFPVTLKPSGVDLQGGSTFSLTRCCERSLDTDPSSGDTQDPAYSVLRSYYTYLSYSGALCPCD